MSTPTPSHKATVGLLRDENEGSASNVGDNTETALDGAPSVSVSLDGQSTEISELGEEGVRRLLGRTDFTVDIDLNFDSEDSGTIGHQQLLKDVGDDSILYRVTIDFDKTQSSFGIAAICKIANFDISADDGEQTGSFTFENADGNKFATSTSVDFT